jgi:hypothetical protein
MRRVLSLIVLGLVGLLVGPLVADKVVLRDGRTLETKKPPEIRGRQAVLTLADGKLVSVPVSEIDAEKTAALAKKAAEAALAPPKPTPTPVGPLSLVDAARSGDTARKATVVLTDYDVARSYLDPPDSEESEGGAGRVVVGPLSATRTETGYAVEGSLQNVGRATVDGVVVTVEALGGEGKAVASAFGALAKDSLAPGETTTFVARIETTQIAESFRCAPRWLSRPLPAGEGEPGSEATPAPVPESTPPPPPPPPAPEPTPPPRQPDYAAPPANAPVGAPEKPGGTYLPPPSANQPKPPGGGG